MDPWDALGDALARTERRVLDLEDRLDRAGREAREALDEIDRLKSRVQTLEWDR